MKKIFIISLLVVLAGQNNAMLKKHKSAGLKNLEQELNLQFRQFQDFENEIYKLRLDHKIREIAELQNKKNALPEKVIDILFKYDNSTVKEISPSIRSRIIAILHQSDCQEKNYLQLHEQLLKTLTNKIPDAELADWAIEYDLTCSQNNEPQRYGTLIDCNHNIELPVAGCSEDLKEQDYKRINIRRKAVGLPMLYYSSPKKNAPASVN